MKSRSRKILFAAAAAVLVLLILAVLIPKTPVSPTGGDSGTEMKQYYFRTEKLLKQHYDKHGREMGFSSPEEYRLAACRVINDPMSLHKTEKEDGDDIYYLEETNEFAVVSTDGYIRTYFCPDSGKKYYDKQ